MGVVFSSVNSLFFRCCSFPGKLVAHDHIFHDKRGVEVDRYPNEKGFLDDDALNEHFDAWNAHNQWLQSIFNEWQPLEIMNVNTTSSNVFSNLQNCLITMNLVLDLRLVPNLVLNA